MQKPGVLIMRRTEEIHKDTQGAVVLVWCSYGVGAVVFVWCFCGSAGVVSVW